MTPDATQDNRFYVTTNGILAQAEGTIGEWEQRVVRRIQRDTTFDAYAYCYTRGALGLGEDDGAHAANLATLFSERRDLGERQIGAAHSYGCTLMLRALLDHPSVAINELHLFAAAAHDSFARNGLNRIVDRGQVGRIVLYCSKNDRALQGARLSGGMYGYLGLVGARDMSADAKSITEHVWENTFDHSSWFDEGPRFERTLQRLLAA